MYATIGRRLLKMQQDDDLTDITFILKGTEIKAHRAVAGSHGGILKDLVTKNDQRIEIGEDLAPTTFETVLEYLYTDSCDINDANLFKVTHAAKSLKLDGLESFCSQFVEKKLTVSNIGGFTEQALQFDSANGLKVCQEYFRNHTESILKTKEFLEVSNEVLVMFCNSEGITCSELDLFSACVKWAKNYCFQNNLSGGPEELRAALGAALPKIRFPSMTMKEFLEDVVPLEILTCDEVGQVIVGWQKKEKKSNFSEVRRTELVQVIVKGYAAMGGSTVQLPVSTTIMEVKHMKLWNNGQGFDGSLYTLSHKGKELFNEVSLGSIYSPGEDLVLQVYSISVNVENYEQGGWKLCPYSLKTSDLSKSENIIKGYIYGLRGLQPSQVKVIVCLNRYSRKYKVNERTLQPGSTVFVEQTV